MTYAIPTSDVRAAATGNHQLRLTELGSLAGCTATLNFQVTVRDAYVTPRTFSVQSPTYVDPKPSL
jgi:hypothetical protein